MSKFIFKQKPVSDNPAQTIPKFFDGPGKGRKLCPECQTYVAVRWKTCPKCSHTFVIKMIDEPSQDFVEKSKPVGSIKIIEPDTPSDLHPLGVYSVITPAGECPVKLKSTGKETVLEWIDKVSTFCLNKRHERLQPSALKYYVRYFYDALSEENKLVCQIIDDHFLSITNQDNKIPSPTEYCEFGDW